MNSLRCGMLRDFGFGAILVVLMVLGFILLIAIF